MITDLKDMVEKDPEVTEARNGQGTSVTDPADIQEPVLAEMVRRLVEAFRPDRIYLFGSRARQDVHSDSDYDLMVILPDDAPPERRRSRLAYEALRGTRVAADVLVWTAKRFNSRLHLAASLPAVIEREGRLIYVA